MTKSDKAAKILELLKIDFPKIAVPLDHSNAHELLFATMLSAQCTDVRVNMVTPVLFKKYHTIKDYAEADIEDLKKIIHSTGFYNQKAKSIISSAQDIETKFGGKVPDNMADLVSLRGVARKTANVVLIHWFHKNEGIVVDTHVKRVAYRLGLTTETDPEKIEQDLMKLFPQDQWGEISLRLIFHGRKTCIARKPHCSTCILRDVCPRMGVTDSI